MMEEFAVPAEEPIPQPGFQSLTRVVGTLQQRGQGVVRPALTPDPSPGGRGGVKRSLSPRLRGVGVRVNRRLFPGALPV